ncbi:MAG: twin-arginine translocase TatA/TatE family subunit [Alphaproteobacteria bacterium]|nr:twin-arginine translocase TatA/TatE family subunit [Alphaproteobacteria bacterium]
MLDFGFPELLVIIALAVLVVGPNEIPKIMVGLGRIVRRLQYVRFAMTQQFDDFMREHDLEDIRKSVNFEEKRFDEAAADDEYDIAPAPEQAPEETPEVKDE